MSPFLITVPKEVKEKTLLMVRVCDKNLLDMAVSPLKSRRSFLGGALMIGSLIFP
jgi:hypothetical protein